LSKTNKTVQRQLVHHNPADVAEDPNVAQLRIVSVQKIKARFSAGQQEFRHANAVLRDRIERLAADHPGAFVIDDAKWMQKAADADVFPPDLEHSP
jgi:hypothetical protein